MCIYIKIGFRNVRCHINKPDIDDKISRLKCFLYYAVYLKSGRMLRGRRPRVRDLRRTRATTATAAVSDKAEVWPGCSCGQGCRREASGGKRQGEEKE